MDRFLKVAKEVALGAGAIQRKYLGKVRRVEYKGEIDIVTEVDRHCEDYIIKKIRRAFPGHDIYAEESGRQNSHAEYNWLIDPLDGTVNFTHGCPIFCVSVALEYRGEIILGVVFDPMRDELFVARKGKGATLNGKRMFVTKREKLIHSLLVTGFAYAVRGGGFDNFGHFKNFVLSARAVRRLGSAALDMCYVACGRFDGYWELGLNPWDVAAGKLLIEEAGGKITGFDGSEFSVYDEEILASNGHIHRQMERVLNKGGK